MQAGDYTVNVKASGPVTVSGNPATTIKLAAKQRSSLSLALDAGGAGTAQLDVDIKGPKGLSLARHYALDVKPATQILARRSIRTLAKGESLTLTGDMFSDLVPGTGSVSLSASLSTALDAATILKALDRYPHGCSEQITSRAMPLLYVNDLAAGAHLAMDTEVDQRIKDADRPAAGAAGIERVVRAVVGRRRRRLAGCLRDGLPDPRPRKGICGT